MKGVCATCGRPESDPRHRLYAYITRAVELSVDMLARLGARITPR